MIVSSSDQNGGTLNPENGGSNALSSEVVKSADEDRRTDQEIILERSMRYEYYIHYLGVDRRLERWVTEHFIRVDD